MATENPQSQQNPNPQIPLYCQTRATHHAVITSDWQAQAQVAIGRHPEDAISNNLSLKFVRDEESGNDFSVVDTFNNWWKQPNLVEVVAAIKALTSVIRSSQATTVMELELS